MNDTRNRREVVGQLLDYAARAVVHRPVAISEPTALDVYGPPSIVPSTG